MFANQFLLDWWSDRWISILLWLMALVGFVLMLNYYGLPIGKNAPVGAVALYSIGSAMLLFSVQTVRVFLVSFASKLVERDQRDTVVNWCSVAMIVGRTFGPVMAAYLDYTPYMIYSIALLAVSGVPFFYFFPKMKSHAKAL